LIIKNQKQDRILSSAGVYFFVEKMGNGTAIATLLKTYTMNAKVLLTALALGGAAVYAAKRLSRNGKAGLAAPKKNRQQRGSQAFSPVRTPTPAY
jgi:hypothetical protein